MLGLGPSGCADVCTKGVYGGIEESVLEGGSCGSCGTVREPRGYIGRCEGVLPVERSLRNSEGEGEDGEGMKKDLMEG